MEGALAQHHLTVTDETYHRLLVEFDRAAGDIAALLEKRSQGDFSTDTVAERFPSVDFGASVGKGRGVSITALLEAWSGRLKKPRPQTITRYTGIINQLIAYLTHDDAERLTDADIVRWHGELMAGGIVTHDTFIKAYRAAISTVYSYGMTAQGGKLVTHNPAAGLLLEGPKKQQSRPKSFYVEEAHSILRNALEALTAENNYSGINRAAMRWVPWICAYTGGARGRSLSASQAGFHRNRWSQMHRPVARCRHDQDRAIPPCPAAPSSPGAGALAICWRGQARPSVLQWKPQVSPAVGADRANSR